MPLTTDNRSPVCISLPQEQKRQLLEYQSVTGARTSGVIQLALREFFEKRQQVKETA